MTQTQIVQMFREWFLATKHGHTIALSDDRCRFQVMLMQDVKIGNDPKYSGSFWRYRYLPTILVKRIDWYENGVRQYTTDVKLRCWTNNTPVLLLEPYHIAQEEVDKATHPVQYAEKAFKDYAKGWNRIK